MLLEQFSFYYLPLTSIFTLPDPPASSNLGCFLQAAVLCQFLEEIDYSLAFKCLTEKSSNFQDAMDSYYGCIYDTTMLEYIINLHCKKGEHKRKLLAISFIRQLELNYNKNDKI